MKAKLVSTIENSRAYTLAVANAMPEKSLKFRPSTDVWSFLELMNHIAYGIHWWEENYIRKVEVPWNPPAAFKTRKETLEYLDQAFGSLKRTVDSIAMTEDAAHGVYATLDHITHHRGQATTYLRANGIAPPEYIY
jgi:uncharacterized damage-inducible protein DinB